MRSGSSREVEYLLGQSCEGEEDKCEPRRVIRPPVHRVENEIPGRYAHEGEDASTGQDVFRRIHVHTLSSWSFPKIHTGDRDERLDLPVMYSL